MVKTQEQMVQIPLSELNRLRQDWSDMYNAYQTIFCRCACGRMRERGIVCPDDKCPHD